MDIQPHPPTNRRNGITHPALVYFGGKWRIAPKIVKCFPLHRKYVEPFGGAASVLLCKPPAHFEIYNDLNDDLVNLFSVLRTSDGCRRLIRLLQRTPYAEAEHRRAFEPCDDPIEAARRLLVRSYMSFHPRAIFGEKTVFRFERSKGAPPAPTMRNAIKALAAIHRRFRHVTITSRPAINLLNPKIDGPDVLYYLDPPYVPATRLSSAKYRYEMSLADHEALLSRCLALKGHCVISGYASDLYMDMLRGWEMREFQSQSFCTGVRHQTAREMIWIHPRTAEALRSDGTAFEGA